MKLYVYNMYYIYNFELCACLFLCLPVSLCVLSAGAHGRGKVLVPLELELQVKGAGHRQAAGQHTGPLPEPCTLLTAEPPLQPQGADSQSK